MKYMLAFLLLLIASPVQSQNAVTFEISNIVFVEQYNPLTWPAERARILEFIRQDLERLYWELREDKFVIKIRDVK